MSGFALTNKAFFSAVIFAVNCQKGFPSSRRFTNLKSHDSLNPGISCQPVTAPHWRCHPNTNDGIMKPSEVRGAANITHTLTHTSLGNLRTPIRGPVTRSAPLGQSKQCRVLPHHSFHCLSSSSSPLAIPFFFFRHFFASYF